RPLPRSTLFPYTTLFRSDGVFPAFQYAVNGSVSWKNFDLSILFQGVEGRKLYLNNWGIVPFVQGAAPTTEWLGRWTEDNPSTTIDRKSTRLNSSHVKISY